MDRLGHAPLGLGDIEHDLLLDLELMGLVTLLRGWRR
jgi:hypothetical protein